MDAASMRRFWDARAREEADHHHHDDDAELETFLGTAGVTVRQNDVVLDLGCGPGRLTRPLARRAAHVIALDVSPEMLRRAQEHPEPLNNVTWLLGDGESLAGIEDASLDGVVSRAVFAHIPDAKLTLGYIEELGRVLKPGGWAAFGLSTDPRAHEAPAPQGAAGTSRRDLLRGLAGRRPAPQRAPELVGSAVPLDALGAVATSACLVLEDIEGSGTRRTVVRATRLRG